MKKMLMLLVMTLIDCGQEPVVEDVRPSERYSVENCRYYPSKDLLITPDGNKWIYQTDEVSGIVPYDGMPVWAGFDDNGTDDIIDDIVLGLVYDRETAIYDKLEESFSEVEEWEITRVGNHIHIDIKE